MKCQCVFIRQCIMSAGGLWVDYDLQSSITGLFVTGEANFPIMGLTVWVLQEINVQGLADGYFVFA